MILTQKFPYLVLALSALAVLFYLFFAASTAFGVSTVTVRGNLNKVIPGPKLIPIGSQPVSILCNGVSQTATTDSNGLYMVTFNDPACNAFSPVSTRSTYNASTITRQVSVSSEGRATIDLIF